MQDTLADILKKYEGQKGAVIPILQKLQERQGFLSKEALAEVAKFTRLSDNEIFGVATFYAQFRFTKPGDHSVKVCLGTACHVRGGEHILEAVERHLDVERGGTTKDFKFSLERVACFGSCALGPVMVIDKDVYGRMTTTRVKDILDKYQ